MDHEARCTVQDRAQVIKRPSDIDVGDVHVPVLVRNKRLHEARSLQASFPIPTIQHAGRLQHPVHRGRAHSHDVRIEHHEHHERHTPISLRCVRVVIIEDRLPLFSCEPVIARYLTVVRVHTSISLLPSIELLKNC